jgi:flavin reductase (DIM6/NTAB) family NADH-FMN oxidoreductase RutF
VAVDDDFDRIVNSLDPPMQIVTAWDGTERSGCLAGFATQCSMEPRRWLVCISKVNHTFRVVQGARTLIVHHLRADQFELARLFGSETEDQIDKFARCQWRDGPDGTPILAGCDWIAGRVIANLDAGDHVAFLLDVTAAGHEHPDAPQLGFQAVRNLRPGHPA